MRDRRLHVEKHPRRTYARRIGWGFFPGPFEGVEIKSDQIRCPTQSLEFVFSNYIIGFFGGKLTYVTKVLSVRYT